MTETEIRFLNNNGLSADARIIGLYILGKGPGEHEIEREAFEDLLSPDAGKSRVQRALGQLQRSGWIIRRPGGRGHSDCFSFSDPEARHLNADDRAEAPDIAAASDGSYPDSSPKRTPLNGDSGRRQRQLSAAPSTGTTPSTNHLGRAQVRRSASEDDLDRIREFLGEHSQAADLFDRSADHSPTWAGAVFGAYGPAPTRDRIWNGLPEEERPSALAAALQDYAGEGKAYNNRLFEGFLSFHRRRWRGPARHETGA